MSGCVGDGENRGGGGPVGGGEGGGATAGAPAAGEGDRRRRPVRAGGVRPGVSGRGQVEELEVPVPEAGAGKGSGALLVPDLRPVDDGPRRRRVRAGSPLCVRLCFFRFFSSFFLKNILILCGMLSSGIWMLFFFSFFFLLFVMSQNFDVIRVVSCNITHEF